MTQKIAVAIVHGIGNQRFDFADGMIGELKRLCGEQVAADLVFKPVHWAPEVESREQALWETVKKDSSLNYEWLRSFIMRFVGDAIAYQPSNNRRQIYDRIHDKMSMAMQSLAAKAGHKAPLCVIAHSLGTIITHNYFFDLVYNASKSWRPDPPLLAYGDTLTLLYTMGSPLAIWSLRYADKYAPIEFPGRAARKLYEKAQPKWVNIYDSDDVVGYPISNLSDGHRQLAKDGLLEDQEMNVGSVLESWNPASHAAYWTDEDVTNRIAADLKTLWYAINFFQGQCP